jgi:ABC-type multidrug transport system ATPase subunit
LIEYKNIGLTYENKRLFENFSATVRNGEHVCFAGPSGRGKTTLLKMIPGLVVPDSGSVTLDGMTLNPQNLKKIRNLITWIPQNVNLPVNNANEMIEFMNLNDYKEQIALYLEKLNLDENYFDKHFSDISGGEKQRVVIAVTLAKDKPVIVMDEPTSALDKDSVAILSALITSLEGKTVISSSHNQQWLEAAERIIEL